MRVAHCTSHKSGNNQTYQHSHQYRIQPNPHHSQHKKEGGERKLKFGDIVLAAVSTIVLCILISYPLSLLLAPVMGGYNAFEASGFIVFILGPIITGYIYAKQIKEENRMKTILKIAVLVAFIAIFMVLMDDAAVEWPPYYKAEYLKANPTATPTPFEWYNIQLAALTTETFAAAAAMLIFTIIGLYIGSTLKKPTKTQ